MRYLFVLAFVVGISEAAWAQPSLGTVANVITIAETQRDGSFVSGSAVVPANATGILRMRLTLPASDYADTSLYVFFRVYRLLPGGTWQVYSATGWPAGNRTDPETGEVNPRPWFEIDITPLRGYTVRAEIDLNKRVRVGAVVELVTPN